MALDPARVVSQLRELQTLTGDEHGAQRVAWTDTWNTARAWLAELLDGLPLERERDAAGNDWWTLRGDSDRAVLIGGHIDSVPNGGWLDGCLNVVAGAEVLRRIAEAGSAYPSRSGWSTGPTRREPGSAAHCSARPRPRARCATRTSCAG